MPTAGDEYGDPEISPVTAAPPRRGGIAPGALFITVAVLALVFLAVANFNDEGNGGTGGYIVTVAITLVIAAALLFWLWHRFIDRAAHWSLIFGVVAVLACIVFWSGLPFAFGVTAIGLGVIQSDETRAKVGIALGGLAVVAAAVGCIFG